jgi:hypothetical protein
MEALPRFLVRMFLPCSITQCFAETTAKHCSETPPARSRRAIGPVTMAFLTYFRLNGVGILSFPPTFSTRAQGLCG